MSAKEHANLTENKTNVLISIILPTYNRGYIIAKAIDSVISQTYKKWELIIVDDASTDDTRMVIGKYTDCRIKYIYNTENKGANYCRNLGVTLSRGKYISFLDSDNFWERDKIRIQLEKIIHTGDHVGLIFCRELVRNGPYKYFVPDEEVELGKIKKTLCEKNIIDTNTVIIKKECFDTVGGFDEKMPRLQDWEFFFRVINVYNYQVIYISDCLNSNIIQTDSISMDDKKYVDAMLYFLQKHFNIFLEYLNFEKLIHFILADILMSEHVEQAYVIEKIYETFGNNKLITQSLILYLTRQLSRKNKFYSLLYTWKIKNNQTEESSLLLKYFQGKGTVIAIYGLGKWGELFYEEIKKTQVHIMYGIDKNIKEFHGLSIKKPTDKLEKVDFIVVTVFQEFEKIKSELEKNYHGKIVSIETLINQQDI